MDMNKITNIMTILFVIAAITFMSFNYDPKPDYTYCVEYGGGIYREELSMRCYDFGKAEFVCRWEINGDELVFIDIQNDTNVIARANCTKYINVFEVD